MLGSKRVARTSRAGSGCWGTSGGSRREKRTNAPGNVIWETRRRRLVPGFRVSKIILWRTTLSKAHFHYRHRRTAVYMPTNALPSAKTDESSSGIIVTWRTRARNRFERDRCTDPMDFILISLLLMSWSHNLIIYNFSITSAHFFKIVL